MNVRANSSPAPWGRSKVDDPTTGLVFGIVVIFTLMAYMASTRAVFEGQHRAGFFESLRSVHSYRYEASPVLTGKPRAVATRDSDSLIK